MTKDVLVTVRGLQMTPDGDDTIEVTTTGKYYERMENAIFSMMRLAMIPT